MEDYDRIEVAFVLDTEPSLQTYESLFDAFPRRSGPEYGSAEFNINYWDENGKQHKYEDYQAAAKVISFSESTRVGVWMDRYELQVTKSRTGEGLLSSVPHVKFSTEIYAFEDPDKKERLEAVKSRRKEFVEVLSQAARILKPRWGFGRRGGIAVGDEDSVKSLSSAITQPLYEYNYFRPETVKKIGLERIQSAPVWLIKELENGGAFISVREPPKECWEGADPCVKAADHLNIPLAETNRYY